MDELFVELFSLQKEIMADHIELEKKKEAYKAKLKEKFGVTDGEQLNMLQLLSAMRKLIDHDHPTV